MELDTGHDPVLDRGDHRAIVIDDRHGDTVVVGIRSVRVGEVDILTAEIAEER
jgi:hypothetical protein